MALGSLAQQGRVGARCSSSRRAAFTVGGRPVGLRSSLATSSSFKHQRTLVVRAAAEETVESKAVAAASAASSDGSWVPVCKPEDLPKGVRKEVDVDGRQVLMFWYRNQMYAIESRSPAEGAYSEGFIKAKFTQDFAIECPSTGSLFSLKDGSIMAWYPNNPVLRALTPQDTCRRMEIYPVKLTQEAIWVDVSKAGLVGTIKPRADRGGAGTALEDNNVFTVQPNVYFEGQDPTQDSASVYASGVDPRRSLADNAATLGVGLLAAGIVGVAGTAVSLYYEDYVLLAGFWLVLGGGVGFVGFRYLTTTQSDAPK